MPLVSGARQAQCQIVARLRGEIAEPPGPEYSESLLEQLARDRESRLATG
jgi:hypothetical protein